MTGSVRGLGLAFAKAFLAEGYSVAITARKKEDLDKTLAGLKSEFRNAEVLGYQVDLSDAGSISAYSDQLRKKWYDLDILVNNAGTYMEDRAGEGIGGNLEGQLGINLLAAVRTTDNFLDMMKKGSSWIVNVVSIAAKEPRDDAASYTIAKSAMMTYTNLLRRNLRKSGIRVLALYPGPMNTASWDGSPVDATKLIQPGDVTRAVLSALGQVGNSSTEEIVINTLSGISG